jgi:non-heme chloroperoxidase
MIARNRLINMTEDLEKIDVPALILHGEEDQLVSIADTARLRVKIVKKATLSVCRGAPHGMTVTEADRVNQGPLTILRS